MENKTSPQPKANGGSEYESLNDFITAADTALTNALLPDVLPLLQKVGYQPADINAKLADLQALRNLAQQQLKEYGDQYKATDDYKKQLALLNEDYPLHVELGRIEFEDDPAALATLGLNGRRMRARADFSKQALQLYNGALANTAYAATLAAAGVDAAKLMAMQAGFKKLEALDKAQTAEMGEAQQATALRNAAWDVLEGWMRKFYKKAKIAFRNHPQMSEKLGLLER